MSKVKARKVLAVQKPGPEYSWFHLMVDGMKTLSVQDSVVRWMIDEEAGETVAYIRRKPFKHEWESGKVYKGFEVTMVKIVGPRKQIENLLINLGMRTPKQASPSVWLKSDEENW